MAQPDIQKKISIELNIEEKKAQEQYREFEEGIQKSPIKVEFQGDIKRYIKETQRLLNDNPLSFATKLDKAALKNSMKEVAAEIAKNYNISFGTQITTNDVLSAMKELQKEEEQQAKQQAARIKERESARKQEAADQAAINKLIDEQAVTYSKILELRHQISQLDSQTEQGQIDVLNDQVNKQREVLQSKEQELSAYGSLVNNEQKMNRLLQAREETQRKIAAEAEKAANKQQAQQQKQNSSTKAFDIQKMNRLSDLDKYVTNLNNIQETLSSFGKTMPEFASKVEELYNALNDADKSSGGFAVYDATLQSLKKDMQGAIDLAAQLTKEQRQQQAIEAKYGKAEIEKNSNANKDAATAYKELTSAAKEYYNYRIKQANNTITINEANALRQLEEEWEKARAAEEKYAMTVRGDSASLENYNKARAAFDEADVEIAIKYSQQLEAIKTKFIEFQNSGKYTQKVNDNLQDIIDRIVAINEKGIDLKADDTVKELASILAAAKDVDNALKLDGAKQAATETLAKLRAQIEKIAHENSAMGKKLKEDWKSLELRVRTAESQADVKKLTAEINKLKADIYETNQAGKGFFDSIGERLRSTVTGQIAQYFSFNDIIRYGREAAEIVKDYDSALTEMRKVSDESVESLLRYQNASFGVADTVGTTALELQNSTADWMRLGESMEDAAQSAKDATILLNVSEFENINEATEALVSASQAYQELDKIDIIDVLNNIGKYKCRNIW